MKIGDAVMAIRHVTATNVSSPEYGRTLPQGYIDIIVSINDKTGGIGLQGDKDPAGWFWSNSNFRLLATEDEMDAVLTELELAKLN